jgi:hypothetical protein
MALKVNMATNNARVGFTILLIAVLFTVGYHSFPEYWHRFLVGAPRFLAPIARSFP